MAFKPSPSSHLPPEKVVSGSSVGFRNHWAESMGITEATLCRCGRPYREHLSTEPDSVFEPCVATSCQRFRPAQESPHA